jgi:hypothetical protein
VLAEMLAGALLAAGKVPGYSVMHKYGRLPSPTNDVWEDVWAEGGAYTWQPAAVTLGVSSASTADTSAGTGARTLEIQGLDADYVEQSEVVLLNGQTKVESANAYLRVFRAKALTAGAGEGNAGKIYIYDTADTPVGGVPPTATRIMATIVGGYGQTQMALYTIPAGYSGFLLSRYVGFSIQANQSLEVEFWTKPLGGAWLQKSLDPVAGGQGPAYRPFIVPMDDDLGEKTDLRFRAKASAASIDVVVEFDLLLVMTGLLD